MAEATIQCETSGIKEYFWKVATNNDPLSEEGSIPILLIRVRVRVIRDVLIRDATIGTIHIPRFQHNSTTTS